MKEFFRCQAEGCDKPIKDPKSNKSGLCYSCGNKIALKKWRKNNKPRVLERQKIANKKYYAANREELLRKQRAKYQEDKKLSSQPQP